MAAGFSVVISATDRATATFDQINKSLKKNFEPFAKAQRSLDRLGASTRKFSDIAGITDVGRGIGGIARQARSAAAGVERLMAPLTAVTGVASVAGVVALTRSFAQMGTDLSNTAARIGIPIDRLQVLQNTARMAGVSSDAMTGSLGGLANALNDARWGRNPMAAMLARNFGMGDLGEMSKKPEEAMLRLADVAERVNKAQGPQAAANLLRYFGVSEELVPIMIKGAAAMRAQEAEAAKLGVITKAQADASRRLTAAFVSMDIAGENLGASIGEALAPVLVPLLTDLSGWVSAHRGEVGDFFRHIAADVGAWASSGGPERLLNGLEGIGNKIIWVVDQLGGWESATEDVFGLWVASKVAAILTPLGQIGLGVAKLTYAFGTELVAAINASDAALDTFGKKALASPTFRTLSLLLDIYERAKEGIPESELPEDSPLRRLLPGGGAGGDATPGQGGAPPSSGGSSWWRRHAPTWLGGAPSAVSLAVPPEGRALLDSISVGESDGTYKNQPNPSSGAFGRYQFLPSTWDEVSGKTGLSEVTPENQDKNAWFYAQERYRLATGRELSADLRAGVNVGPALSRIWTSLPGGSQPNGATAGFADRLAANLRTDMASPPGPNGESSLAGAEPMRLGAPDTSMAPSARIDSPSAGPGGAAGASGQVGITITHQNPPPGTTLSTTSEGDVKVERPRVETALGFLS